MTVHFTQQTNGLTIIGYEYIISTIDNSGSYIFTSNINTPLVIEDLSNGEVYSLTLRAKTATATSLPSNTVINIIPYTTPDTPIITSIEGGDQSINIYFDETVSSNGRPIINYIYSLNAGSGDNFSSASQTQSPLRITGLTNGTIYSVAIKSLNTAGYSQMSNIVQVRPQTNPMPPYILDITVLGTDIIVKYQYSSNGGGNNIIKYQYRLNETGPYIDISGSLNVTEFSINNLSIADYNIQLRVVTDGDTYNVSSIAYFSTYSAQEAPPPPTITNIEYTANTNIAYINFTQPMSLPPIDLYYVSINDGPFTIASYNGIKIGVPNLVYGTQYRFKIRGKNKFGFSAVSNYSSYITPIARPAIPHIYNIVSYFSKTQIFFIIPNSNGSPIIKYQYRLNAENWIDLPNLTIPGEIPALPNNVYTNVQLRAINLAGSSNIASKIVKPNITIPIITMRPTLTVDISSGLVYVFPPAIDIPILKYKYIVIRDGIEDEEPVDVSAVNPFFIPSLPPNIKYQVKVSIGTSIGDSDYSPPSLSKFYLGTYPLPPIIYTIIPDKKIAKLYILKPDSTNRSPNISYLYSLNNNTYIDTFKNDSDMPILIDISQNVDYNIRVRARNVMGISTPSKLFTFISDLGVPGKPYFSANNITINSINITIIAPKRTGGSDFLGYKYSYDGINYYNIFLTNGKKFQFSNLSQNTTYNIHIVAYNSIGMSMPYIRKINTLPF